ncbi:hypothetical protein BpHYR1_001327 [Brachionus plicatilis]|uniref:Uncharacterized protein n=1 Tax=Brachionus plicatilis TaxID=10195 RepID=A0A3M7T7L1_BRAPC|nr:hypothetical protein BpHYR1_001327 [Brachionus plicatilis]
MITHVWWFFYVSTYFRQNDIIGSNKNVTPKKTGSNTVRTVRPSRPFNGNRPSDQANRPI